MRVTTSGAENQRWPRQADRVRCLPQVQRSCVVRAEWNRHCSAMYLRATAGSMDGNAEWRVSNPRSAQGRVQDATARHQVIYLLGRSGSHLSEHDNDKRFMRGIWRNDLRCIKPANRANAQGAGRKSGSTTGNERRLDLESNQTGVGTSKHGGLATWLWY